MQLVPSGNSKATPGVAAAQRQHVSRRMGVGVEGHSGPLRLSLDSEADTLSLPTRNAYLRDGHGPEKNAHGRNIRHRDVTVESSSKKSHVTFLDIARDSDKIPLRWIHITAPNRLTLASVAQQFDVKLADLERCLWPQNPPQSYRYGSYLVNRFAEIALRDSNKDLLKANAVTAILGEHFLITLSDQPSTAVERVRAEIVNGDIRKGDVESSNYLFTRLLGCSLHLNEKTTFDLEKRCQEFEEHSSSGNVTATRQLLLTELNRAIIQSSHAVESCPELLESLSEERNLFGSIRPRDCLGRYSTILEATRKRLTEASHVLDHLRDSWRIAQEEYQNRILFRIAVLSAALGPISLLSGIFGINFSDGLHLSNTFIFSSLIGGALASAGLIAALVFGSGRK